ncbi:hypothetical protein F5J12DRAFT_95906 [Pisolithus orientalis]|uniref:uncharacterized protein n=1 Tax=Pisolithus orientalis TaxID=936130 RepID=UPI002225080D|nr:uncharacterized protein F5J12DRAFT_95906 [Pisolithus orientalis]KAI6006505.1 hypothetical protein F5J12DRAFT_95906 [Pisolithus orientalis]
MLVLEATHVLLFILMFINEFALCKVPKQYEHLRRVRFYAHRGVGLRYVVWHNDTPGTYMYYMHYSGDATTMKFLVAALWILDTLHALFTCHYLYYYLITNYGVPTSLEYLVWCALALMDSLAVFVVQCFFAHKIHYLCRRQVKWFVTAPIMLFVLVHFGFCVETTVLMFVNKDVSSLTQIRNSSLIPGGSAVLPAEVLITVSLCILLYDSSRFATLR